MKLFELVDSIDPEPSALAVLCCYEDTRTYYIDMPPDTDPWSVPFILSSFASRGQWAIGSYWSRRWVESRVVPESRQNLGEVLKENGLERYDTLRLLELTGGRNSQDSCHLERVGLDEAPAWFRERERGRVVEAVPLDRGRLLVAFRNGDVYICKVGDLEPRTPMLDKILSGQDSFARCEVSPGGRGVRWGTMAEVSDAELRAVGEPIGLSWDELAKALPELLLNADEAGKMLGCTRQNLSALSRRGSLSPVKASGKSTLYLRADIRARLR